MTCTRCQKPTRLRASGLLVHEDRSRDADHLPPVRQPGDTRSDAELEQREREILGHLVAAGFEELPAGAPPDYWSSPLGERYLNGDR